jgi:hypothetical protein
VHAFKNARLPAAGLWSDIINTGAVFFLLKQFELPVVCGRHPTVMVKKRATACGESSVNFDGLRG